MRTGGSNSGRSRAMSGSAAIVSIVWIRASTYLSAWSADQVAALKRQILSRSFAAFGVSRYPATSPAAIRLPHPGLERRFVELAGGAAFDAGSDLWLDCRNRRLSLLVLADKVADIVARIAEAAVPGTAFDPVFHRVGKGNIHRG